MKKSIVFCLIILVMCTLTGCFENGAGSAENPSGAKISEVSEKDIDGQSSEQDPAYEAKSIDIDASEAASSDSAGTSVSGNAKITDSGNASACHGTLTITCTTILDNIDRFDPAKLEILPEDGILYSAADITFSQGETVFDILLRVAREEKIHMESVSSGIYGGSYIEGIGNIYEFDCGELSGWMYKVNGSFPGIGCSSYIPEDGDRIEWIYTCDLGRDIGGDWHLQKSDN